MDLFASSDADAASASASASGLSASQTTGLQASKSLPRKTRSACDRCHSQKLRCIKTGAQSSCDRCLKLKRLCRFGPRAARASPKHAEPIDPSSLVGIQQLISTATSLPNPNTHVDEITSDMDHTQWSFPSITTTTVSAAGGMIYPESCYTAQDMIWPALFPDSLDSSCQDGPTFSNMVPVNERNPVGIDNHDKNRNFGLLQTSPVKKLASLNVALHECSQNLPSVNTSGEDQKTRLGSRKGTIFAIDELFRLTAEFIEVFKSLSHNTYESSTTFSSISSMNTSQGQPLHLPHIWMQSDESASPAGPEPPTRPCSLIDEATMFMISSCHCRIIKIYESVFQMMQDCIAKSLRPHLGSDWAVILPRLQVGSIASSPVRVDIHTPIPSKASTEMYMLMITMLSSRLWEQIRDFIDTCSDAPMCSPASSSPLVEMMFGTMRERAESLLQTIEATKQMLKQ